MKKKIRLSGIVCALLVAATCMCAFAACGGETKYTYSGCTITVNGTTMDGAAMDATYKDTYIVVTDTSIKMTHNGNTSEMQITKDGNKDKLGGDYADEFAESFKQFGTDASIEMYGQSVDGGYNIVITVKASIAGITSETTTTLSFKA